MIEERWKLTKKHFFYKVVFKELWAI